MWQVGGSTAPGTKSKTTTTQAAKSSPCITICACNYHQV